MFNSFRQWCLALPRPGEGGDDAVQGAQFLLGALRALEEAAQVADHAWATLAVAQKTVADQLLLEVLEEVQQLRFRRRPAAAAAQSFGMRRRRARSEPLVADDQHRLRQVQRREAGVERHRQYRIGERY